MQNETQKIYFIINSKWSDPQGRGSSIMRAYAPTVCLSKFIKSYAGQFLPDSVNKNDIVVFVKDMCHPDILKAKKAGCIVVYDPIDDFTSRGNEALFDVIIAASESHAKFLCKNYSLERKKIIIIDHLHTNITRIKHNKNVKTLNVGCVEPGHFSKYYENKIKKVCEENYANFFHKDFSQMKVRFDPVTGISKNFQDAVNEIDIAMVLFEKDSLRIEIKPSTKMLNYASFGIPTVCKYQTSYDNVTDKFPEFKEMLIDTLDEACVLIKKLIIDETFYQEKKELFIKIGDHFHMDNAYSFYVEQINSATLNHKNGQ